MIHRHPSAALACCLLALAASPDALSKTLYVETFGTSNGICSKAAPCKDLQDTVANIAGNNDRIVVGPGNFSAGTGGIDITQSGLKLTSVAGARGTTITQSGNDEIITINAPKVTIGQRRKGFTFRHGATGASAIYVPSGEKVRIEGNIIIDEAGNNSEALYIETPKSTIKGNEITGYSDAISVNTGSFDGTRHLIADNHVTGADNVCILLESENAGKNKLTGNVLQNCRYTGFEISASDTSGDKITNNVIEKDISSPFDSHGILVFRGSPAISRNAVRGNMTNGILIEGPAKSTVKDNLVSDTVNGMSMEDLVEDTLIQGNTFLGNDFSVVFPRPDGSIKKFFKNNLLDYGCPYDINGGDIFGVVTTPVIKSDKTFHDQGLIFGALILNCVDNTAELAVSAGFLDISSFVTKANPVKYKGGL